jgi:hypothetical protein
MGFPGNPGQRLVDFRSRIREYRLAGNALFDDYER